MTPEASKQDPATEISRLYPASSRPVNPGEESKFKVMMGNSKVEIYRDWVKEGNLPKFYLLENTVKRDFEVRLSCHEVTTCCPLTKQPDFGTVTITYVPDKSLVETKSLKEYVLAFRDKSIFQEEIVLQFLYDFVRQVNPKRVLIHGEFTSRGGVVESARADWKQGEPLP